MATMNISLPDELSGYVQERVAKGGYATHSDYVRALIRNDQEQLERFRALIQEGLESPVEGPMDQAFFDSLKARIGRPAGGE